VLVGLAPTKKGRLIACIVYVLFSILSTRYLTLLTFNPPLVQPLSDTFKNYILNLDIEADARLLHEHLNICEEAIDIFRASSSLLKAGVKAGLSLYSIAVMCCRNDNLGEIPSKLERLSSMASELSSIALENEKWHHTAASRAIVDQLTPQRANFLSRGRAAGYRMNKSASSGEFLSLSSGSGETLEQEIAKRDSPGMAHSSASDSSSDTDEVIVETEECEDWAASLIADMSKEEGNPVTRKGARSGSIASDDGSNDSLLSSSPKGFWTVRPGASPIPNDEDDASLQWSPQTSLRDTIDEGRLFATPPAGCFSLGANANSTSTSKRPSVSFAPILPSTTSKPLKLPATVNVSEFKSTVMKSRFVDDGQRQDSGGMIRSKSHPALSRSFSVTSSSSDAALPKRSPKLFTEEYENFRKYYLKFIDLVVVREMTAAVHSKIAT